MNDELLRTIGDTWMGTAMRDIFWMWPLMENFHFLGLSILFGGLVAIDLRVIGVARFVPMKAALTLIPYVMIGFAINLITGIFFFSGDPFRYFYNLSFQWKMALVFLAGINALWFWFGEHAKLSKLADGEQADFPAKVIAAISLALWVGVIILGRLIPYLE
ncbi:MAG: hypothetical protein ACKVOF_06580 [Pseudohongiellaceae bacterium]|jgi:hypothetical protein